MRFLAAPPGEGRKKVHVYIYSGKWKFCPFIRRLAPYKIFTRMLLNNEWDIQYQTLKINSSARGADIQGAIFVLCLYWGSAWYFRVRLPPLKSECNVALEWDEITFSSPAEAYNPRHTDPISIFTTISCVCHLTGMRGDGISWWFKILIFSKSSDVQFVIRHGK